MSECTGHCCRMFFLPCSPSELQTRRDELQDGNAIADMVYFQGSTYDDRGRISHWYGCVHHDAETGRCRNYENRPRMCSEYPYGKRCEFQGCTLGGRDAAPDVTIEEFRSLAKARWKVVRLPVLERTPPWPTS